MHLRLATRQAQLDDRQDETVELARARCDDKFDSCTHLIIGFCAKPLSKNCPVRNGRELRPFYDRVDHLLDIHSMGRYAKLLQYPAEYRTHLSTHA